MTPRLIPLSWAREAVELAEHAFSQPGTGLAVRDEVRREILKIADGILELTRRHGDFPGWIALVLALRVLAEETKWVSGIQRPSVIQRRSMDRVLAYDASSPMTTFRFDPELFHSGWASLRGIDVMFPADENRLSAMYGPSLSSAWGFVGPGGVVLVNTVRDPNNPDLMLHEEQIFGDGGHAFLRSFVHWFDQQP